VPFARATFTDVKVSDLVNVIGRPPAFGKVNLLFSNVNEENWVELPSIQTPI